MTTMSFKTFTFPHNPERITVTTETRIATAHCPEYGPIHQNRGWPADHPGGGSIFTGPTPRPSTPPWRP